LAFSDKKIEVNSWISFKKNKKKFSNKSFIIHRQKIIKPTCIFITNDITPFTAL
jgi:hypothetical protein